MHSIQTFNSFRTSFPRCAAAVALCAAVAAGGAARAEEAKAKPAIRKLGVIDCDMVEATPIVFKGKLYRFEYVRPGYKPNTTGESYFRFIDAATGKATPSFAATYDLGCAWAEGETMYVYGADHWGGSRIQVFWSSDLENWKSETALKAPAGWTVFNCSVCKGPDGFVMAFEVGAPESVVGAAFTNFFAFSKDAVHFELAPLDCVFTKDRYSACPSIRWVDGHYYAAYLEARPGPAWETWMVRSKDLKTWELSPLNPVLAASPEDKTIRNAALTPAERERIGKAVDRNNSDMDFCEFGGKVVIAYSWGNQEGNEFLAEAEYEGTLAAFLKAWFPAK